jgi:hypothetical protein
MQFKILKWANLKEGGYLKYVDIDGRITSK